MVIGVACPKFGNITFEVCMACAKCLPRQMIKGLRKYPWNFTPKVYAVKEIIKCLRREYYKRTTPPRDEYIPLKALYSMARGKVFENLIKPEGWNELPCVLDIDCAGTKISVRGTVDSYDFETGEISEIKSIELDKGKYLPRSYDILQVQCYGTLLSRTVKDVDGLKLVYLDMSEFQIFPIESKDMTAWMTIRASSLHIAISTKKPPVCEVSGECRFCPYSDLCHKEGARENAIGSGYQPPNRVQSPEVRV